MQKLYDDFAMTKEGNGRLNRVLLMIYFNLHLRNDETVETKKITKYHEILVEYEEGGHKRYYNDEATPFEPDEYKVVLEFYKFFEDNWKIIMEHLRDFQEVFEIIRMSNLQRKKNLKQRKTRKMRKVRNSKSRKLRCS
jgi:hypothetical protein